MLYLDYSRKDGEWIPNEHGGNENLGALRFLKKLNETVYADFPDVQTIAEESTAWPMVSRPTEYGGLGFGMKWDMGWMHDALSYFEREPIYRPHHQGELTFRTVYAFTENFCLPLSHDEVVHGKGSLVGKMPGDHWQKMANLRALFGYQYGQPGKKLLFMGDELAQLTEWDHDGSLPWWLLDQPRPRRHAGVGAPPQPPPPRRTGSAPARLHPRRLPVGRCLRFGCERHVMAAPARSGRHRSTRRRQCS